MAIPRPVTSRHMLASLPHWVRCLQPDHRSSPIRWPFLVANLRRRQNRLQASKAFSYSLGCNCTQNPTGNMGHGIGNPWWRHTTYFPFSLEFRHCFSAISGEGVVQCKGRTKVKRSGFPSNRQIDRQAVVASRSVRPSHPVTVTVVTKSKAVQGPKAGTPSIPSPI